MIPGVLVGADEGFLHQVTETFATVGQSDRSWTEKAWAQACAHDGSLQVDLGLGVYPNRGVIDAYAGVSRGATQWTVRANRSLDLEIDTTVGPIAYEIVDPLRAVRLSLAANDIVPVSFDVLLTGVVPPGLEERELKRSSDGRRIDSDILRFHQPATAEGWVEVEGDRVAVTPDTWSGGRDRSWGVRYMIGNPETDLPRVRRPRAADYALWSTLRMRGPDGDYGLHLYYHASRSPGRSLVEAQGGLEAADGSRQLFAAVSPELTYDPANRRLAGGRLVATLDDGSVRPLLVEVLGDTGFHLGTGLYFSFDGKWHGQSRGQLEVTGERIDDCDDPAVGRRIHQIRDCVVRVTDPVGGGTGVGSIQTMLVGDFPELGLSAESSFV